ncbi:hypothetical protein ILYODFUR_009291 [Ilyodon furcidens]|uniref:Uncharacterized protein n=1 Tax=Ilyodon furcidens TaxID=33524 RepID=A0ABV0UGU2_9TELE
MLGLDFWTGWDTAVCWDTFQDAECFSHRTVGLYNQHSRVTPFSCETGHIRKRIRLFGTDEFHLLTGLR